MHWYDPELRNQRVPLLIVDQLRDQLGISRDNFRQIISRTLRSLEKEL